MYKTIKGDLKILMEAYSNFYDYGQQEIIDEQDTVIGKKGEDWYAVTKDPSGKIIGQKKVDPNLVNPKAKERYERLRSQQPQPKLDSKSEPQIGNKNAEGKFYTGPKWGWQSWQTTRAKRLLPDEVIGSEPPQSKPKPKPETRTPAPTTPPATRTPAPTTPPATRTPAPTTPPATRAPAPTTPPPSSQDGIKQWASIYGPGGSKELKSPTERQKQIFSSIKSGQEIPKVRSIKQDVEDIRKMKTTTTESLHTKYDAFDLILEYLASQGHVETLDEALYVMMEMDGETIKSIVEGSGVVTGAAKVINTVLKPGNQTPEQEKEAVRNLTNKLNIGANPVKGLLGVGDKKNQQMIDKRRPKT